MARCADREEGNMTRKSAQEQTSVVRAIPTFYGEEVDKMPTAYANHLIISHAGPEFFLVFGVVTPPFILPGEEAKFEELESLEALPVAKIAVSPEVMVAMAKSIHNNVERYLETKDLREQEILSNE
jgi:hypothetical protein